MSRLNYEQLNMIKEKFGVKNLWSFSKVSTFTQCTWLYFLRYVKRIKVKSDNCYTFWGSIAHDLIQGLYDGEHTYEQMIDKFEAKLIEYNMLEDPKLKFPNENEFSNYIDNLRHYFKNVKQLPYKVVNEKPVLAVFEGDEKYVFQGYIDSEFVDDEDYLVILDYKTSSMSGFSGKKLIEKSRQLMIYALGISIFGRQVDGVMRQFPLDKIKIRYDMMKYCTVSYQLKNGNLKETKAERRHWVTKIANQLRKDLEDVEKSIEKVDKEIAKLEKKLGKKKITEEEIAELNKQIDTLHLEKADLVEHFYNPVEINEKIEEAIQNNNLDNMPKFVREKYTVSDCYIDVEITDEIIEEFKSELVETLNEIIAKEKEEDKEQAFTRGRIEQNETYYCTNLCELRDHCEFYKEYKEHSSMFLTKETPSDEELLKMLGL
jgi:hypothetical protein